MEGRTVKNWPRKSNPHETHLPNRHTSRKRTSLEFTAMNQAPNQIHSDQWWMELEFPVCIYIYAICILYKLITIQSVWERFSPLERLTQQKQYISEYAMNMAWNEMKAIHNLLSTLIQIQRRNESMVHFAGAHKKECISQLSPKIKLRLEKFEEC